MMKKAWKHFIKYLLLMLMDDSFKLSSRITIYYAHAKRARLSKFLLNCDSIARINSWWSWIQIASKDSLTLWNTLQQHPHINFFSLNTCDKVCELVSGDATANKGKTEIKFMQIKVSAQTWIRVESSYVSWWISVDSQYKGSVIQILWAFWRAVSRFVPSQWEKSLQNNVCIIAWAQT